MNRPLKTALLLTLLLGGAPALGACGKLGELDRPPPLFSSKQKAQEDAERAAANRAKGEGRTAQSATSQTNGDYTQDRDGAKDPALRPIRAAPPPGSPPTPFDSRPFGGVLPDPYADPNGTPR